MAVPSLKVYKSIEEFSPETTSEDVEKRYEL
jgi:hypothetical protein